MLLALHAAMFGLLLLFVIVDGLRGSAKAQIQFTLLVLVLGPLASVFVASGWKAGLVAIVMIFVYGGLAYSIGTRIAVHILRGGGESDYVGLPPASLQRIETALDPDEVRLYRTAEEVARYLTESADDSRERKRDAAESALLDLCESGARTRAVMAEFGATRSTLRELYDMLCAEGMLVWCGGHLVAASAIAYEHTLRYLLTRKRMGLSGTGSAFALMDHFMKGKPLGDPARPGESQRAASAD